ncbi:cytochrome P450 [Spirillospora sp. NPDC127200]
MKRPPGPPGGDVPGATAYEDDRPSFLAEATALYGDVWQLAPRVCMVAGLENTRQVFRRTGQEFDLGRGAFSVPRRARRPVAGVEEARLRVLRHSIVSGHAGALSAQAAAFSASWPADAEVPALPRLADAVSQMTTPYFFGADADDLMHAERELVGLRTAVGGRSVHLPGWVPAPSRLRVRRSQHALAGRIREVIDRRVRTGRTERDMLGRLMSACAESGVSPAVYLPFRMVTAMVAAREMITPAAGWALYELARNPDWAERIAAESAPVLAWPEAVDASVPVRLPLADAFVRETLRLHPPNWLIPRAVTAPVELGGYALGPGDRVMVSPYLLHRDARYATDPDAFDPGRWLGQGAPMTSGAYLPFGAGPRLCPGAALASLALVLVTAHTARHRPTCPRPVTPTTQNVLSPADLHLRCGRRD